MSSIEVGTTYWMACFAHILPKGRYPKYRTFRNNLILIHPIEHQKIDQGTAEQRERYKKEWEAKGYTVDWDIFYDLQFYLKQFYPYK